MITYIYVSYKKNKNNFLLLVLALIYTISAIMSVVLFFNNTASYKDINIFSYAFLFILIVISFYPIKNQKALSGVQLTIVNITFEKFFSYCLILLYLPTVLYLIPESILNYQKIIFDFSYAAEMYDETAVTAASQTGHSLSNIFSVFRGAFSQILIFWTFYYSTRLYKGKWIAYLLWICTLYPFLSSFSLGSRTMIVWWVFEIMIGYLIFYKFLPKKTNKYIKLTLMVTLSVVLIIFSILTIGRFATREYTGTDEMENSLVLYSGSSQINFANVVFENDVIQYGDNCFPFFRSLLGLSSSSNLYERQAKWGKSMKTIQGAFYSLYGDLCFDMSCIGALLFIFLSSIIINKRLSFTDYKNTKLSKSFLLYFYCCILYNGLFYFSYKTIGGNLTLITNVIFYYLIKNKEFKLK